MDHSKMYSDDKTQSINDDAVRSSINTMIIVKVVKVYAATQRVDVKPCISVKIEDVNSLTKIYTRTGKKVGVSEIEMPEILNVPICHPRAGNFMITLPIQVGDNGMLIFCQQDISAWKERGGSNVEQKDLAQFDINNCIFLPYVASDVDVVSDYNADALEIRAGDDKMTMAGDGKVVFNCDVVANGVSLETHTHPVVVPSTPHTGNTGEPN